MSTNWEGLKATALWASASSLSLCLPTPHFSPFYSIVAVCTHIQFFVHCWRCLTFGLSHILLTLCPELCCLVCSVVLWVIYSVHHPFISLGYRFKQICTNISQKSLLLTMSQLFYYLSSSWEVLPLLVIPPPPPLLGFVGPLPESYVKSYWQWNLHYSLTVSSYQPGLQWAWKVRRIVTPAVCMAQIHSSRLPDHCSIVHKEESLLSGMSITSFCGCSICVLINWTAKHKT